MSMQITYGDTTLDFSTLPPASLSAMLRRGVSHYLGSEVASKVKAYFDSEDENGNKSEMTEASRAAKVAEVRADFLAKLEAGTVGVSVRGPAVDPVEKIARQLAKAEIVVILKKNGLAWPKTADATVDFPNGDKFTGAQLIDRRMAKEGERLTKEAAKVAAERARKAKKLDEADASVESL